MSGAAALAALLCGKVPDLAPDSKVAVIVTGSNVSLDDLKSEVFGGEL
jgi:threonine dehydratase